VTPAAAGSGLTVLSLIDLVGQRQAIYENSE
jgi:hypothetical protein